MRLREVWTMHMKEGYFSAQGKKEILKVCSGTKEY